MRRYSMTIDGKSVGSQEYFTVTNPADGSIVGQAPRASSADLDLAVTAANRAFLTWSKTSDTDRRTACEAVTAKLEELAEELAQLVTLEQGKPLDGLGSRFELGGSLAWAAHTAGLSMGPKTLQDNNEGKVVLHRKPIGVVGSITPWNWPLMIAIWHILPALRTGNTVVIKPSPFTPLSTLRMVEGLNTVLPAGVLNVVTSDEQGDNFGALMAAHPGIHKMVFTGSTPTGKKVYASGAETMKRLTLELGGNDAAIVLADVDPKEIAEGLFWGAFINNGQTCAAMKRLYVHADVYDAVCEALTDYARDVPTGASKEAVLGPIANQIQFDKVARLVAEAKKVGRVLLGGAPGDGLYFPPTLIADLSDDDALVREEQFGPALPILKFTDVDDAIARANDSENGLGGSVWSKDIEKATKIAMRLECGSVWINKHGAIQPNAPFGGVKQSGFGVQFGDEGLAEYTSTQTLLV